MSDFRSLLGSFQAATGMKNTGSNNNKRRIDSARQLPNSGNGNGKSGKGKGGDHQTNRTNKIQNLWRKSQIQKSIRETTAARLKQQKAVGSTCTSSSESKRNKPIHLAICATIVSTLPQEQIWKSWLDQGQGKPSSENENMTASMYIHAKTPSAIPHNSWLKSKCIPISHNPNWNDIRIVKAMLSLIEYALKDDERTTHIMFVTESCIPIATINELAQFLREKGRTKVVDGDGDGDDDDADGSWCSFLDTYGRGSVRCTRFDEHACFQIKGVPEESIYKALPGWCLLTKKHAKQILDLPSQELDGDDLYPLFRDVWAPEEVYFPTALSLLGVLPGKEIISKSIMWAKWDDRARGQERAHPIEYDGRFGAALVREARQEGCYFMRKLKRSLDVRSWNLAVCNTVLHVHERNEFDSNRKRPRNEDTDVDFERKGRGKSRSPQTEEHRFQKR